MNYLLLIHIGPVQDFINSARRTRDLSFGSWLLSELARAAAYEIANLHGLESLIFPAPLDKAQLLPDTKNFIAPNKILALVPQFPDDLSRLVRKAVLARLYTIRDQAYTGIPFSEDERKRANAQVEDLVDFFWAAFPLADHDYQKARRHVEALMGARKNTRDFNQVTWGAFTPKSSLDGQLESVIPEQAYASPRLSDTEKHQVLQDLYCSYRAGPAEHLSGVDLLKRWGIATFGEHFPSTSHIATLPFLQRLTILNNAHLAKVSKVWQDYIALLKKAAISAKLEQIPHHFLAHPLLDHSDGSLLFEERLVDMLYIPGVPATRNRALIQAKNALRVFYTVLDEQWRDLGLQKARPDPYYALLQADGDGMGELIDAQAEHGSERHRALSQKLSQFSAEALAIVECHDGSAIYAGGDDILAFLPLHTVLACARELRKTYCSRLRDFTNRQQQPSSLSVGIGIVHHLDSLHSARIIARETEQRAKRVPKKNALAITVSKRSGEDYSIEGPGEQLEPDLETLIAFCRQGVIPAGTAYELRELVLRVGNSDRSGSRTYNEGEQVADTQTQAMQWAALRVIQRKLYVPRDKVPEELAQEAERYFKRRFGIEPEHHLDMARRLDAVVNELIVARALADAEKLALPEKRGVRL